MSKEWSVFAARALRSDSPRCSAPPSFVVEGEYPVSRLERDRETKGLAFESHHSVSYSSLLFRFAPAQAEQHPNGLRMGGVGGRDSRRSDVRSLPMESVRVGSLGGRRAAELLSSSVEEANHITGLARGCRSPSCHRLRGGDGPFDRFAGRRGALLRAAGLTRREGVEGWVGNGGCGGARALSSTTVTSMGRYSRSRKSERGDGPAMARGWWWKGRWVRKCDGRALEFRKALVEWPRPVLDGSGGL